MELLGGINLYQYGESNPQARIDRYGLDTAGCDWYKGRAETPCQLECCAQHDFCYDQYNCSSSSWGAIPGGSGCDRTKECQGCNAAVRACIKKCGKTKVDDQNKPNFYCARRHKFIKIPGDYANRIDAEKDCEYDHCKDCKIAAPPPRPPKPPPPSSAIQ